MTAPDQTQQQPQQQRALATAAVAPTLPSATAALLPLIDGLDAMREQLTGTAMRLVTDSVQNFHGWYSTDAITAWTQRTVSDVQAVLATMAGLVDAYTANIVGEMTGGHVRPAGAIDVTQLRQGITHAGAYGRVADTYRYQQSRADQAAKQLLTAPTPAVPQLVSPLDAALQRAADVANTDAQKVLQQQTAKTLQAAADAGAPIIGWRRVIHPEMSKSGTCGLCVAASTRIYKTGDLMPLHTDCHCVPVPVTLAHDPGAMINDADLGQLYAAAGSTGRADLKKTRYQVYDNGELGPTLAPEGAKQRSPRQVAADTAPPPVRSLSAAREQRKQRQLQDLHDSLQRSLQRVEGELMPADPAKWQPYRDTLAERVADLEQQLASAA